MPKKKSSKKKASKKKAARPEGFDSLAKAMSKIKTSKGGGTVHVHAYHVDAYNRRHPHR